MQTIKPNELIQLAEFAGWTKIFKRDYETWMNDAGCSWGLIGNDPDKNVIPEQQVPNYPNDLDACIRDLVGKMATLEYWFSCSANLQIEFRAVFAKHVFVEKVGMTYNTYVETSPTLSLAICLAVGKYLESVSKNSLPQSAS